MALLLDGFLLRLNFQRYKEKCTPRFLYLLEKDYVLQLKNYAVEPGLEELDGLFFAQHRLGIINAYLEAEISMEKVYSTAHGLTNTMRLSIANLL